MFPARMTRFITASSLLLLTTALTSCGESPRDAEKVYREFCSSCHGVNLEGGTAPSMLDDEWAHGGSDEEIARQITIGNLEKGMPAWGTVFSEPEIRALVVYIRERRAGYERRRDTLPAPDAKQRFSTAKHTFRVETVIADIDTPWSINWLTPDTMIVTEKSGGLRLFTNGKLSRAIKDTPEVETGGQAGLLEVAPHPNYATNGWIYLTYSEPLTNADGDKVSHTKVVRGRIKGDRWTEQQTIYAADIEHYRKAGGVHYGSRIAFDANGYLFFTIGERGAQDRAQDLGRPHGKVFRLHDDGSIPADNPFLNTPGALPEIWSYGHRNPQGLDFDPRDGRLWETEHGPRGGDELNIIRRSANYGWPVITYGMNYNGTPITSETARDGMEQPATHWTPSIAVCGIDFYEGTAFPQWTGNLIVGALAQQQVRRVVIEDGQVISQEIILQDFGRVRDVANGPDGYIYLALNGPNKVVRLVPVP